jgi:hypothetical protein
VVRLLATEPGVKDDHVISGLIRKRAEIAGKIKGAQAEARKLKMDLVHVDAVLRLYVPDIKVEDIKPKRPPAPFRTPRGKMTRRILDHLRAHGPVTALDLAKAEMAFRGADAAIYSTAMMREGRVGPALRTLRERGLIRSYTGPDGLLLWAINSRPGA